MRQAPHPEAPDQPRIGEGCDGDQDRARGEGHGEERPEAIDPLIDLLRRVEEAEQEAENQRHPERVGEGLAVGDDDLESFPDRAGAQRAPVLVRERFGEADVAPHRHGDAEGGDEDEDAAPAGDHEDALANIGGEDRHDHEDHHGERHDACHPPPAERVAHDRDRNHTRRAGADPLHGAHCQQLREARRRGAADAAERIDGETHHQHGPAPVTVGNGPVEELRDAEGDDVGGQRKLAAVLIGDRETAAHLLQRRQDDVDRHGVERHEERNDRHELCVRQSRGRPFGRTVVHADLGGVSGRFPGRLHYGSAKREGNNAADSRRMALFRCLLDR